MLMQHSDLLTRSNAYGAIFERFKLHQGFLSSRNLMPVSSNFLELTWAFCISHVALGYKRQTIYYRESSGELTASLLQPLF